jgi:hypothetical protein
MAFKSMSAFDQHRYGSYSDRKCRTPDEMVARNYHLTDKGYWSQMPDERYSAHLAKLMGNVE